MNPEIHGEPWDDSIEVTAPSPGGVQRWDLSGRVDLDGPFLCHRLDNASGDWVRYGDIAGMEKGLQDARVEIGDRMAQLDGARLRGDLYAADRDEARKEVARLRKALEEIRDTNEINCQVPCPCCECFSCLAAEALRGAAGEVTQ